MRTPTLPMFFTMLALAIFTLPGSVSGDETKKEEKSGLRSQVEELIERYRESGQSIDLFAIWGDIGERAGFEIGNGRKLIKNLDGGYLMKIYKDWEVGINGKFTEVVAPIYEGVPRGRLQINVLGEGDLDSAIDTSQQRPASDWMPVVLGDLQGVQKSRLLPSGINSTEVRLFRDTGEVIVMTLDGAPGKDTLTAYDKIQHSLTTFKSVSNQD